MIEKIMTGIAVALVLTATLMLVGTIIAFPIMICWNITMPAIFGLSKISWLQALCLYVLSMILIKTKGVIKWQK